MSQSIEITPAAGPIVATVRPPGSKSITNRALVCAALAAGDSRLTGALDSEDTRVMIESLRRLGINVQAHDEASVLEVTGCGGRIAAQDAELFVANSGTTIRFLTALAALGHGRVRLAGVERMNQRPIQDLLDALAALGADVQSEANDGCPPVRVQADGLPGGRAQIRGEISSQYLSGLLMAAPYARSAVELDVQGSLVSQPYVQMTLDVMAAFGVDVRTGTAMESFRVPNNRGYRSCKYAIEPDASAASYFFAAAAITGGRVTVEGLSLGSMQGDVAFCTCLEQMGCEVQYNRDSITVVGGPLRGVDVNMNKISDTVQTLAAVALFAEGATRVTGVAHNRHKETDRIGDLATELRKLGATVEEHHDGLTIAPRTLQAAEIETYRDHRMAMSLALVGLRQPGVVIRDPGCTEKTYPHFFRDLARLTGCPETGSP